MNKVQCDKGHYFDRDRFQTCPICNSKTFSAAGVPTGENPSDKTVLLMPTEEIKQDEPINPPYPSTDKSDFKAAVDATASTNISSLKKTVAYYDFNDRIPPVAWIVCVKGIYQGEAFECITGKNRIGRENNMDICLSEDHSISRDTHAVIIFEPKQRRFYLQAGTENGLVYLNGELIFSHCELKAYDLIALGKTEFIFLPLCGEKFDWAKYIPEE